MASFTMTDCVITINSVDLSDFASSVSVSFERDAQEDTAFGDTSRSRIGGLRDYTLEVTWNQDFAAGAVDATIWPLFNSAAGTSTWSVKATSAATSATNPLYSGTVLISEYTPLDGSVGDLATLSTSWPGAVGTGATRATS